MKKIKNTLLYLLAALSLLTSCDNWLTIEPEDGVTKDHYWSTKEEVYAAVIGLYSGMLSKDFMSHMYLWGELRGETLLTNETYVNSSYQAVRDGEITSTNAICNWSTFYKIINFCNTVVEYAPKAQESDKSFTDALVKQYQAEAIALRSLLYFYLVRTFRDVPYYTQAYVSDDQTMMLAKSSGDSILRAVSYDLEAIVPNLSTRYQEGNAAMNKGRMTRGAVYALLADINLWLSDYESCIRNCDRVINSGEYSLLLPGIAHLQEEYADNPATNGIDTFYVLQEEQANAFYKSMYVDGNCDESIFEIQFELEYPNLAYYDLFNNSNGDFMANVEVLKENYFLPSEISAKRWVDLRSEDVSYKGGCVWKPLGTTRDGKLLESCRASQDVWNNNVIVYRLSEVYLMKAEALVEQAATMASSGDSTISALQTAKLSEARKLITTLRNRANATEMTDLCLDVKKDEDLSVTTMEQFVYQERIREMMFEGKRWFDALRFAKRNDYEGNNLNYLQQMAVYGASVTKVGTLQNKLKNTDFHYLPIYESEMKANKLLVQNPFYND